MIALAIFGIVGASLLVGFLTSISSSETYRSLATMDTVLRSAAAEATSQIQQEASSAFACPSNDQVVFTFPAGYTAQITSVNYWTGTAVQTTCTANSAQLVTITVTSNGQTSSITFVVDDPLARPVPPVGLATHLEFLPLGQPANVTSGSPITPPPVVAVEDASGDIVTSDLSPVNLTITAGSGTAGAALSPGCSGVEFYGVATFSGCSITTAGTTYTLTATDGTLGSATSQPFNVLPAAASQLAFTAWPSGATGGAAFSTQPVVTVKDTFGNTVTTDTSQVSLAITNPAGATLSCTTNPLGATAGVGAFSGCSINKAATGYTLTATDGSLYVGDQPPPSTSPSAGDPSSCSPRRRVTARVGRRSQASRSSPSRTPAATW